MQISVKKVLLGTEASQRAVLTLVVLLMVFGVRQGRAEPNEPEARGHTLSYWLGHYASSQKTEERQTAEESILEIGTNGLPAMIVWLHYDPAQTKTEIMSFLEHMSQSA